MALGAMIATTLLAGAAWASDTQYEYDNLGRLTKVSVTNGPITTYTYDAAGNRTATTTTGGSSSSPYGTKVIVLPLLGGFVLPIPGSPF
ncbi:RHS repeat domain-containing protein [Nitrospirillum viridazoti]|uniref:RHS repeat domain-containing protein n=1 Tax=Nitrospirillum viridazoti TaxID=3144925 RepID=UPI0002E0D1F5|nr:RHS repeat domain-containing protein [Nitrospirillum amazonense]